MAEAHSRAIALTAGSDLRFHLLYEYFSTHRINAVPRSVTAFRRDPTSAIVTLVFWDANAPDKSSQAREIVSELYDILAKGQSNMSEAHQLGYSNHGKRSLLYATVSN